MTVFRIAYVIAALAAVLHWTASPAQAGVVPCVQLCPVDISHNGVVDIDDLLLVIGNWGDAGGEGDVNFSGMVDIDDLLEIIAHWGEACPAAVNDSYANALHISVGGAAQSINFCTEKATTDGLTHASCGKKQINNDLWFRLDGQSRLADGDIIHINTCGSTFDTKLAVYQFPAANGCACTPSDKHLVACSDDAGVSGCETASAVQLTWSEDSCVLIRVGGSAATTGSGVLNINRQSGGDDCGSAYDMSVVTPEKLLTAFVNTDGHLPGVIVPLSPCTQLPDGEDVWFKFQIACEGAMTGSVRTCNAETDFDTILTLYRGECDDLVLLDCNDDSDTASDCILGKLHLKSRIELPGVAVPGDYYVRVSGYDGAGGNFRLIVEVDCEQ